MLLLSILIFIVIFSLLVIVHEGGHFFAAKQAGVKVEEFALGFGKKIWGFKKNGTEFNINLIPFGGFVRLLGEEEASEASDSFEKAPLWGRMWITVAGVIMNWIFAIVLLTLLYWHGSVKVLVSEADKQAAIADGTLIEQVEEETGKTYYKYDKQIQLPIHKAAVFAATETFRLSKAVVVRVGEIPGEIIRERRMPEGLAGPLGIGEVVHRVVPMGFWELVKLTALLSISLAVMNLLPIPALDGGRLVLQLYELLLRHRPNPAWERGLHLGGFIFLLGFLAAVTWNDVVRIFL